MTRNKSAATRSAQAAPAPSSAQTPPPATRVTVVEVAQRAGVSLMTVSRALSGKGYVAEATRQKVQEAADALGYVANVGARVMKGGRTGVLGLLVSDFQSPVIAAIISAISRVVKQAGMDLILYDLAAADGARPDVVPLLSSLCDGLLLILPGAYAENLDQFERVSLPVVLVNYWRAPTSLPVVRADNYEGAHALTRHLLELGHRRIAFVRGTSHSGQSQERERGYLAALNEAGVSADPQLIAQGDFIQRSGFEQAGLLLQLREPPTAIFCANDLMALGALDAARAAGLAVPTQLSIAGFDDILAASQSYPALTTVKQDYEQLGDGAVRLLLQHISEGARRGIRVELQSHLVVRDSTAAPPARAKKAGRAR